MVTFPAGSTQQSRAFQQRQDQITDKLRWTPIRSKRRQSLEAELAALVHRRLALEVGEANVPATNKKRATPLPQWWQK